MPTVIISSSRNAIMNSRTRLVIDQLEMIAIGVMNTVRMMRNTLIPSTPMRYCTLTPVNQVSVSTNWKPACDGSKADQR